MNKGGFWARILAVAGKNKLLTAAVLTILILRTAFIWLMGLMPQDAYYSFYGEHPALSYYDHPPGIAYLLKVFTTLFGKHVYVVKLADTVTTLLFMLLFYFLSKYFLGGRRAGNALLLLFSTLMVTILSLVSTPDVPLMLFWTLSLLCLYQAIFRGKRVYWLLSGIAMGLAFNSKYTGILLPVGLLLFLALSGKYRRQLLLPWCWLSAVLFCITILPVVLWNLRNNLASFRFQSADRVSSFSLNLVDFLGVLGHQSAILTPVLLFALVWFLYRMARKYGSRFSAIPPQRLFLLCFFVPVFLGFFAVSLVYWVKLNWMMPAYISGIILVAPYFNKKYLRWQLLFALAVHLVLAVELLFYPVPVKSDDIWMGWGKLAHEVRELKERYPADFVFSADDYKTSAVLNFYREEMIYGQNVIGRPALQFDYVGTDLTRLKGRNALFINSTPDVKDEEGERKFVRRLQPYFDSVHPEPPIIIRRGNRVVRKFLVYRCMGYHPERLPAAGGKKR